MSAISDSIEKFILTLLGEDDAIELQRNELAHYFSCAPSQINYVLATRFNLGRGYAIESRRGGGGYIRVVKVNTDKNRFIYHLINGCMGKNLSLREASDLIHQLYAHNAIAQDEARIMQASISDEALAVPLNIKNMLRAEILRQELIAILKKEQEE